MIESLKRRSVIDREGQKRATETRKQRGVLEETVCEGLLGVGKVEREQRMRQGIGSRGLHAIPLFRRAPSRFSNSSRKHAPNRRARVDAQRTMSRYPLLSFPLMSRRSQVPVIHVSDFIRWPLQLQLHATWQFFARRVPQFRLFQRLLQFLPSQPTLGHPQSRQLSRF